MSKAKKIMQIVILVATVVIDVINKTKNGN